MIKVMWFLKRADHLSLEEFHRWWIERHVPDIVDAKGRHLKQYVVNLRWSDDTLPGKPSGEADWDGVAEQWFETEDDFKAAYPGDGPSATRDDTLKHVSRLARMIVHENPIKLSDAPRS